MHNAPSISPDREKELENILSQMSNIITNKSLTTEQRYAQQFLECTHKLFLAWKPTMKRIASKEIDENTFWGFFERFLNECENGSWSGMARHKPAIEPFKQQLYNIVSQMLLSKANINEVINIIKNTTMPSGANKIDGLTAFPMTGILFASDEDNFMILDEPVLDYFGLQEDYDGALSNYKYIIDKSKYYSTKFNLSMWYVNKAYGILSNDKSLPLKKLCVNCFGKYFKNHGYNF
ncbi:MULTISPECIES: hypothetical protein [unclassified Acidiplasma]|uniref:hypothetical protein n=1 Tax=unclassified Acidiplasma TaxID=2641301 RepID=UPI0005E3A7FF|nr:MULTISPECIES: hypothetical protein [unclassified Acidiplasma]KJE49789.1 hypothetical protein TZ01_01465 [Acidiplasma sp. MBA-1]WMT55508.1 MAG: hypothetical protein RE470_02415 [Acidiplasma sp.]